MLKLFRIAQTLLHKHEIVLPKDDRQALAWLNRRMGDFYRQAERGATRLKRYHARHMLDLYYDKAKELEERLHASPDT